MPVKVKLVDWNTALDAEIWKQNLEAVMQELEDMSGRDLYEMQSYSLCPQYLIDRPCNFAMHGTYCNYEIDSVRVMRYALVDGAAFIKVGDWQHLTIEPYVIKNVFDVITDDLLELWTSYKGIEPISGEELVYTTKYTVGPPAVQTNYEPQRVYDEDRLVEGEAFTLPYFPYVAFLWHNHASFLAPVHEAVIRLEAAYRVVAVENIERKPLDLYLEGVRNVDEIQQSPRRMGRHVKTLPEGAAFHSPADHPATYELMQWEINQLWNGLEKATGVVSTEKLATLSGVSRLIAEKPLLMLSEDIRNVFEKGMRDVEAAVGMLGAPPLEISYKPMREVDNPGAYLGWINEAYTKGVIDEGEYVREFRRILDLDAPDGKPNSIPVSLKWKPDANPKEIINDNGPSGTAF